MSVVYSFNIPDRRKTVDVVWKEDVAPEPDQINIGKLMKMLRADSVRIYRRNPGEIPPYTYDISVGEFSQAVRLSISARLETWDCKVSAVPHLVMYGHADNIQHIKKLRN